MKEKPLMERSHRLLGRLWACRPALRGLGLALALSGGCDNPHGITPLEQKASALGATETPEAAAERRRTQREARRARLDALKGEIAAAPDEPTRANLHATYDAEWKESIGETEGVSLPTPAAPLAPKEMSEAQRQRLLKKMKDFDMSKPADMAAWARIKHQELGR
jgi:hypothetical protein